MKAPLPNHLRTHRKRSLLSQEEIAYLLGTKSGAAISRHERFHQTPTLQTLLAYEMLFGTPIRKLFPGVEESVRQKLKRRVRRLIRKLMDVRGGSLLKRKLLILQALLENPKTVPGAPTTS